MSALFNAAQRATLAKYLHPEGKPGESVEQVDRVQALEQTLQRTMVQHPPEPPSLSDAIDQLTRLNSKAKDLRDAMDAAPWLMDNLAIRVEKEPSEEPRKMGQAISPARLRRDLTTLFIATKQAATDLQVARLKGEGRKGKRPDYLPRLIARDVLDALASAGVPITSNHTGPAAICLEAAFHALNVDHDPRLILKAMLDKERSRKAKKG